MGPHASMIGTTNSLQLALLSAAILGFRHGFDYDHIAAISDITSVQTSRWRGMRLGLLYALGHAAMVGVLGSAVIVFQLSLPHGIDRIAERLVGLTLLILGVYVLGSLFSGNPAPRSRFHVMARALRWIHWKMKSYWHDHDVQRPVDKNWNYSSKSVLMIGVVNQSVLTRYFFSTSSSSRGFGTFSGNKTHLPPCSNAPHTSNVAASKEIGAKWTKVCALSSCT